MDSPVSIRIVVCLDWHQVRDGVYQFNIQDSRFPRYCTMMRHSIAQLKSLLMEGIAVLRSGVWILEGCEAASGEPLKVFYAGSEKQKAHMAALILGSSYREHSYGKRYFWSILRSIRKNRHRCNIAVIEGSRLHGLLYKYSDDVFLPIWLKTRVDIPLVACSHSYKEDLRRIRKCGLSYAITIERDEFDAFYHNMYRPSVNASHGESTVEIGYDSMMALLQQKKCVLLHVIKNDIAIAGALVILGHVPRLWAIGILGNNPEYRKCSAYTAAYHFAAEYLAGQGYHNMHMGMSRGFLNDGILQYKNKWDQRVIGFDTSGYVLKILKPTAGTDAFLANNPYVYLDDGRLYGAVFIGGDNQYTEKDFRRLRKKYLLAGLSGLKVYQQEKNAGHRSIILEI